MRAVRPVVVSVVLLVGAAASVSAGPADLDRTFGNGGSVIVPFTGVESVAQAVVVQPDGGIVAAGAAGLDFGLARCHPDGSLDASFGVGGRVITDFGGSDIANALVLQSDGKLVAAGTTASGASALALARYRPDGMLDPAFGVGGRVRLPGLNVRALVLEPDGMLVVGGSGASGFTLVRYDAAGVLDPTFGVGGVASTDFPYSGASRLLLFAVALQPDGKIVAVGGGGSLIALARFTVDGTLDPTFGTGGRVTTDVSLGVSHPYSRAYRVRVLADGKLVLAGVRETTVESGVFGVLPPGTALVLRYDGDGTIDTTFNSTGIVVLNDPAQQPADVRGLIVQPGGALVAVGWSYFRKRIGSDGTIDPSFSSGDTPSGGAIDLVMQPDGKLVAAGYSVAASQPTFEIVRFGGDCGNGVVDPAEACDDGNATSGDGCDVNCTPTGCGNGVVTIGEDCEPGASAACCSPSCTFASAGTPCVTYGASICGVPQCDTTGTCVDRLVPSPACAAAPAHAATLTIAELSDSRRRSVSWTWKRGSVDAAGLEDPLTTPYALCVYDHSEGAAELAATVSVGNPSCPTCWKTSAKGYRYYERARASGSTRVVLHASPTGVGALQVKASREFVRPATTLPMTADPKVTAQLRNTVGACWGADYTMPSRNDAERFTAKSE